MCASKLTSSTEISVACERNSRNMEREGPAKVKAHHDDAFRWVLKLKKIVKISLWAYVNKIDCLLSLYSLKSSFFATKVAWETNIPWWHLIEHEKLHKSIYFSQVCCILMNRTISVSVICHNLVKLCHSESTVMNYYFATWSPAYNDW